MLWALLLCSDNLHASNLVPSLGIAVPLATADDVVVLQQDVMISPYLILPAGTIARSVFRVPRTAEQMQVRASARERLEQSFARQPHRLHGPTPEARAADLRQRAIEANMLTSRFSDTLQFQAIMHNMDPQDFALIVQRRGMDDVEVVQFEFLDGLLLGSDAGNVVVLGVVENSAPHQAGVERDDRIATLNGEPWQGDLQTFQKIYQREKRDRQQGGQTLTLGFAKSGGETIDVAIPLPRSLSAGDSFFEGLDP